MNYIFLHGLGQTASSWRDTIYAIDGQYSILCPQIFQWFCGSTPSYSNLYQALEQYCGQWNDPVNLCGLSLGGILALQYGILHPDKTNSLVLIGTQFTMPKNLLKLQNIIFQIMPQSAFQNTGLSKKEIMALTKSMMNLDFRKDLHKISCPVLVICGEKDRSNKDAALQLKEQIPDAQFSIIPDAGHEVNADNPVELGKIIDSFYRQETVHIRISSQ